MRSTGTDRYVLIGLPVPIIVPGTLKDLTALLKAAIQASSTVQDIVFEVQAVRQGKRKCIRAFQEGTDITLDYLSDESLDDES